MTVLHRFVAGAPGFVIIILAALNSQDRLPWVSLSLAVMFGLAALPLIILRYERFRYWITEEELVIRSGVLKTQNRSIPIERIQNIEIVQRLLSRIFSTARINVVTAGSTGTEGVLEFVSIEEAKRIRETIRQRQQKLGNPYEGVPETSSDEIIAEDQLASAPYGEATISREMIFSMSVKDVLLSGVFRFSLLYIAIFFSTIQFIEPDPEAMIDRVIDAWGPAIQPLLDSLKDRVVLVIALVLVFAAMLSWISGILVNLNRLYNYRLWLSGSKIEKAAGLLTVREGTIPLKKVQAGILRTNPAMRLFDFWALELQTIGLDVGDAGNKSAIPFAKEHIIYSLIPRIFPIPISADYNRVSRLTIRRIFVRYTVVVLILLAAASAVVTVPWTASLVLLVVAAHAILHYLNHGYSFDGKYLSIKRGVLKHTKWTIPVQNIHVLYSRQSLFQRRLGLKSIEVDSAGAGAIRHPVIIDLPASEADDLLQRIYSSFQNYYS